jgi:hypothetical protein
VGGDPMAVHMMTCFGINYKKLTFRFQNFGKPGKTFKKRFRCIKEYVNVSECNHRLKNWISEGIKYFRLMVGCLCQMQKEGDIATVPKKKLGPFRNGFRAEQEYKFVEHCLPAEKVM